MRSRIESQKKRYRRIYYLQKKVESYGFKVDTPVKEVDVYPHTQIKEIPVKARYYVSQLIKEGFNIQIKLL